MAVLNHSVGFNTENTSISELLGFNIPATQTFSLFEGNFGSAGPLLGDGGVDLVVADYFYNFGLGLDLILERPNLGTFEIAYPIGVDVVLPDENELNAPFSIGTSSNFDISGASITGSTISLGGVELALDVSSTGAGITNIAILSGFFWDGFQLDENFEIPAFDTTVSLASFDFEEVIEGEPIDGVTVSLGTPGGESQTGETVTQSDVSNFRPISAEINEALFEISANPLEVADNFYPALDVLTEEFDFSAAGYDIEAEYAIFAPFISAGYGVVQEYEFTPTAVSTEFEFNGNSYSGYLGDNFTLDALEDVGDEINGTISYGLEGILDVDYFLRPIGSIGATVLGGSITVSDDGEDDESLSFGPVFEPSISGSTDIGSVLLFSSTYELSDDLFSPVEMQFSIETNEEPEGVALLSSLGGDADFGENVLFANDDSSTGEIDITSIFEDGINFFGREFTSLWINNNGSVTFNGSRGTFTPDVITENNNNPEITPFFADVDTRGGSTTASAGGTSTGSNLVYYDFDTENDRFIVTWDDVGYYSSETDLTNAFQLVLTDQGNGDFDIQYRYENIEWTTGNASGGENGLGGTVARAGFTASTGDPDAYFELPASGNQADILALDETEGNTGEIGIWNFSVRSGDISSAEIPALPDLTVWGTTSGDPHLVTLDGAAYDFHAAGEFVLLRSTNDIDFEVQSRMTPVAGSDNLTVNAAIALRFGGSNVMVDSQDDSEFSIDGVITEIANFGSLDVGDDVVFRSNNVYTFVFAGEDGVISDGDSQLTITVESDRVDFAAYLNDNVLGDLEGLLGDGDGNAENDIAYIDGTTVARPLAYETLYGTYRDEWRVDDITNSLFTYDADESLEGFYLADYPATIVSLDDFDDAEVATATTALQEAGLFEGTVAFDNALIDFLATDDESYIEAAVNTAEIPSENRLEVSPVPVITIDNSIVGTDGNDRLVGDDLRNGMQGHSGDDVLFGHASADELYGGSGNDMLFGDDLPVSYFNETAASIYRLYQATLGRAPDAMGHQNWTTRVVTDEISLEEAAYGFVNSAEFQITYGTLGNTGFVNLLYQNVLERTADDAGLARWVNDLESGALRTEVVLGFSNSQEFQNNTASDASQFALGNTHQIWVDDVFRLYQATLNRAPDVSGLINWSESLGTGSDYLNVANGFVASQEFENQYGEDLSNLDFVALLYQNVLGREADAIGLSGWTGRLDDGASRTQVVEGFAQSAEFKNNTTDTLEDWMRENTADDKIVGGQGDDILSGGFGSDLFVFHQADVGSDIVVDLEAWDTIDISDFEFGDLATAQDKFIQDGSNVVFASGEVEVVFEGVDRATFDSDTLLI